MDDRRRVALIGIGALLLLGLTVPAASSVLLVVAGQPARVPCLAAPVAIAVLVLLVLYPAARLLAGAAALAGGLLALYEAQRLHGQLAATQAQLGAAGLLLRAVSGSYRDSLATAAAQADQLAQAGIVALAVAVALLGLAFLPRRQ